MPLRNFIKENFVLAVGLALPVLLVALFFAVSVVPKMLAVPPQYEMLFATTRYDYQNKPDYNVDFFVKDGVLKTRATAVKDNGYSWKKLLAFDAKTGTVRDIPFDMPKEAGEATLKETETLGLDASMKAPDGYEFDGDNYSSGGLATDIFVGHRRGGYRIKKGPVAYKIPETGNTYYYYNNLQFLGWIVKGKP